MFVVRFNSIELECNEVQIGLLARTMIHILEIKIISIILIMTTCMTWYFYLIMGKAIPIPQITHVCSILNMLSFIFKNIWLSPHTYRNKMKFSWDRPNACNLRNWCFSNLFKEKKSERAILKPAHYLLHTYF